MNSIKISKFVENKVNEIVNHKRLIDYMMMLDSRYQDEKEFEDINEYRVALDKFFTKYFDIRITRATKHFHFFFELENVQLKILCRKTKTTFRLAVNLV